MSAEFDDIVRPLEARACRRLGEPGRSVCLEAFYEEPDGFRRTVDAALARGNTNPIGLLVTMVRSGDHRFQAPDHDAVERAPAADGLTHSCPQCGLRFKGPRTLAQHVQNIHDDVMVTPGEHPDETSQTVTAERP